MRKHSHKLLLGGFCSCSGSRGSGSRGGHENRQAVLDGISPGGTCPECILVFLKYCVFKKLDLCILSVPAVFKVLCVIAGPALGEIAEISEERLGAVHKPLGHQELRADKIIVVADAVAEIAVSVDG